MVAPSMHSGFSMVRPGAFHVANGLSLRNRCSSITTTPPMNTVTTVTAVYGKKTKFYLCFPMVLSNMLTNGSVEKMHIDGISSDDIFPFDYKLQNRWAGGNDLSEQMRDLGKSLEIWERFYYLHAKRKVTFKITMELIDESQD